MRYEFLYATLVVVVVVVSIVRLRRREQQALQVMTEVSAGALAEPPSLHPVIDTAACIGCGSCVRACPEQALGLVNGRATLVNPAACIGHGACKLACPVDGIRLVFGTERRGVDIPQVDPRFETNVPGVFIAGELGGMGLIRKAAEQGRQAVAAIAERTQGAHPFDYDVLIVGAGSAGLSAGLAAIEKRLRYRVIEQEDSIGGCVYHYPRHKIVMTAPVKLALVGSLKLTEVSKEKLLEFWHDIVGRTGLQISFNERMERIDVVEHGGFAVTTSQGTMTARAVLLAIGRRGTPRKLGVVGETLPKVVYRLIDAAQYRGHHVLVVGGGDSALEAAVALTEQPGTTTTLSYRGEAFTRVKPKNRQAVESAIGNGKLRLLLSSEVREITPTQVQLTTAQGILTLQNDAVVVCAGGTLPTALLQTLGVSFETKYGTE